MASRLGVTFQAVSKWETGQTLPETAMLTTLAKALETSVDSLLGYTAFPSDTSYYDAKYRQEDYYWGVKPSDMCLKVVELVPPVKQLKLLDIGCGEGKDAVFFARCGYDVSAFDISDAGLEKTKRLADFARVRVNAFKAHTRELAALHTFVKKPFIERAPDAGKGERNYWRSGELCTYFYDWYIEFCSEYVFDCNSGGIPHRHAANRLFARKI